MSPSPAVLAGQVMHQRLVPRRHRFVYPVFYVQLPLRHLGAAACPVFSIDAFNLLSFYRKDHGPRDGRLLLPWIEGLLAEAGLPHDGEIVLQTFPRVLGYVFNPVSFWFCHDAAGRRIAILAEVNNTFGGHHAYLLHRRGAALAPGDELRADKVFHVSPFNQVEGEYRFRFRLDGARQVCRIDYDDARGRLLQTALSGQPRPWGTGALLKAFLRMPLLCVGIMARIHWQALCLWWKGVPFLGADPAPRPFQESTK